MADDARLTWRTCPTCGYMVPAGADACVRCASAEGPVPTPPPAAPPASPPTPPTPPPASAGGFDPAWSAPVAVTAPTVLPARAPGPPAPEGGAWRRVTLTVTVVIVAVALLGGLLRATVLDDGHSANPSQWDARLGDLPAKVERLRGLKFDHPVPVRWESDAAFEQEDALGGDVSSAARRSADRATQAFRALGLLTGSVDLIGAAKKSRQSRVLAYYDPLQKEVVIRGPEGALDAPHRVVLAHELTHVLQDQHFDLTALRQKVAQEPAQSSDALRAVIEGDAVRIEDEYRDDLSTADQAAYRAWRKGAAGKAATATKSIPMILTLSQSAPYDFGPAAMKVVAADGGNAAVDDVFRHGVFTQKLFLDPTSSLTEPAPKVVPAPRVEAGERAVDKPSSLEAYDLYLLLASRGDPVAALDAASGWSGGRMRMVRADGRICVRANLTADGAAATDKLAGALQAWALMMPAGLADVGRSGDRLTLHACDPGADAAVASPDARLAHAAYVLAIHSEFEQALAKEASAAGVPLSTVRCAALEILRSPPFTVLLAMPEDEVTSEQVQSAVKAAVPGVREICGL